MERIRITRKFNFEMAHSLPSHDGPCRNIHGHSYELRITVLGKPVIEVDRPDNGMVMDLGDLDELVTKELIQDWDHAFIIQENTMDPGLEEKLLEQGYKIERLTRTPTCENLLIEIKDRIGEVLPPGVDLFSVRLNETPDSYAEWYMSDQEHHPDEK